MIINESNNKGNKYCVKFKIGDKVRFIHPGGKLSKEIATITGYDKDGFYTYTWNDGEKSNGSSDVNFKKINEELVYFGWAKEPIEKLVNLVKKDKWLLITDTFNGKIKYYLRDPKSTFNTFGIEKSTYDKLKRYANKDQFINEDTVKKANGKWTNRGKDGEHGEFSTKSAADAQRKAMFANGYKG